MCIRNEKVQAKFCFLTKQFIAQKAEIKLNMKSCRVRKKVVEAHEGVRPFYLTREQDADEHLQDFKSKNICDDAPTLKPPRQQYCEMLHDFFYSKFSWGARPILIRHLKSGYCIESKTEISCELKPSSLS